MRVLAHIRFEHAKCVKRLLIFPVAEAVEAFVAVLIIRTALAAVLHWGVAR